MPNRIPAVAAVALVLAVAGGAQAKGPVTGITVCGADRCLTVDDPAAAETLPLLGPAADAVTVAPAEPAPFYRVQLGNGDSAYAPEPVYYVPAETAIRVKNAGVAEWLPVAPAGLAVLQEAIGSLKPYAVPPLSTVFVNELPAKGPASYLKLFGVGTAVHSTAGAGGWFSMLLLSKRPSPWGDGANYLWVSRHGGYLKRDGQLVRIPVVLATRIRARLPLP